MNIEVITDARAALGEGPAWDKKTQTLYWLDILNRRLYAGERVVAEFTEPVGCLAPCVDGHLILGARFSIVDFDPATGRSRTRMRLADEPSNNRINDGKCDPVGRFLMGSMDMEKESEPTGSLYSFDGASLTRLRQGLVISNGLAWSADSRTLYHIDTPTRNVAAFDYDIETGLLARPRLAFSVPADLGWPDGMTSDLEGHLWIAMWGGAKVTRWSPEGRLIETIALPAFNVSSCAFGGPDGDELYVTSARKDMSEARLAEYPLSGGLFRISTGTKGLPAFEFRARETVPFG